jgi:hypothetical protein
LQDYLCLIIFHESLLDRWKTLTEPMKIQTSRRQIAGLLIAFAVPAVLVGSAFGQWWFDLGLRDSERWSHLSGEISAGETAVLRASALLLGSIVGMAAGGASSVLLFLLTRRRPS